MKSFKEELEEIEVPAELSQRARLGIDKAANERRKRPDWKPLVGTMLVTVAALFIVFTLIGEPGTFSMKSTAKDSWESSLPGAYTIAGLLTVLAGACSFFLWRRMRLWVVPALLLALSFIWNIAVFQAHQLGEPVVFPLYIDVPAEGNLLFNVYYAVDTRDDRYIDTLTFGGKTFDSQGDAHEFPGYPSTMHITSHKYQLLKEAMFDIRIEDLPEGLSTDEAFVTFTDGSVQHVKFGHFDFVEPANVQRELVTAKPGDEVYKMLEPFLIEQIAIQPHIQQHMSYELLVDGEVIVRYNPSYPKNNINHLPYQTEAGQRVDLRFIWNEGNDLRTYQGIVQLHGEGRTMNLSIIDPVPAYSLEKAQSLSEQEGSSHE